MLLMCCWGVVSDSLCVELMRLDASAHPEGVVAFDRWAEGGKCPYSGCQFPRVANFNQDKTLWSPGPAKSIWELTEAVLDECVKCWRS